MAKTIPVSFVPDTTPEIQPVTKQSVNTSTNALTVKPNIPSTPGQTSRSTAVHVKKSGVNHVGSLSTPVSFSNLQHYLTKINYNKKLTDYLVSGFKDGSHLRHISEPCNFKAVNEYSEVVSKKFNAEISARQTAGPFSNPPFEKFQISSLNIREKKTPGKYRLIHDLSFPNESSVNSNIPQNQKTVKYANFTTAIETLQSLPHGCYTTKTDIVDAYKIILMHPTQCPLLGFTFEGNFFFDKSLPQGCGSSCRIFETVSSALQAIFEHEVPEVQCVHMRDDFFIAAPTWATCKVHLEIFVSLWWHWRSNCPRQNHRACHWHGVRRSGLGYHSTDSKTTDRQIHRLLRNNS